MTRTITIVAGTWGKKLDVRADVEGVFAIHKAIPADGDKWVLTHVPTGHVILFARTRAACVGARRELVKHGGDWRSKKPAVIAKRHRVIGRAVREKYGHIR